MEYLLFDPNYMPVGGDNSLKPCLSTASNYITEEEEIESLPLVIRTGPAGGSSRRMRSSISYCNMAAEF